jgi:PilZ domain
MDAPATQPQMPDAGYSDELYAANEADRRQHSRNIKVMRVARLSNRQLDAEGLGMVRDVSPGGMMIDAHFTLAIGQSLTIALLDDQELSGEIVWQDGNTVGVRFDSDTPVDSILAKPALKADGKRARLPRFSVNKTSQIVIGTKISAATICDVSQRGAKLQCDTKIGMHDNVLIKLGDHRPVRGTVKWRCGELTGVEFHRLLTVDELAQWLKVS